MIFGRRNGTPPLTRLLRDVVADGTQLLQTEIELVRARFRETIRRTGIGAALLLVAAIFAVFATGGLFSALGLGLAVAVPDWAAALVVAILILGLATLLALLGRSQLEAAGRARSSGPASIEAELADTRYRLDAELEAITTKFDPRPGSNANGR